MIKIEAKADIAATLKSLDALSLDLARIGKKILRALATITKKRVKKRMGAYLNIGHLMSSSDFSIFKGKGNLRDAVYGCARSNTHAVVSSGQMFKAEALEHGALILPKKGKFLTFQADTNSGWVRTRSVHLPAKRWFTRSVEGFESDPDYQLTIDKVIGKAIHLAGLGR